MNGMKKLSVILMLLSLTACASGVQRTVHYEYRPPISHASVHTAVHRYQPIEVTVYADRVYRGGSSTIHLVMVDGEYAEIPMRNKKGKYTRIFAHYHAGVLHFDSDRHCHGIQGASRFKQDNGWHKGRMYSRVSAGKDYDLKGLKLMVRNVDQAKKPAVAKNAERRQARDRNILPEHANVDKNAQRQDRLSKSVQKASVAAENNIVSQKNNANRVDGRLNKKSFETEKQARATNRTPDSRSQIVNRFNRESDHEKRNEPVANVRKIVEDKAARGKNKAPQNVKLSKNEPQRTVVQKTFDERKNPSTKPNGQEKPDMKHVDKSNDRHQSNEKKKNSVAEKKQVHKDRKGMKNKNEEINNDEDSSLDDELSNGNGRNRPAT